MTDALLLFLVAFLAPLALYALHRLCSRNSRGNNW